MKNTRKGFTLVELVIVIAVIAILAGVIIGTFASVVNRAKESAKIQEMKNAELAQKAEDILAKIDNANWYGWEDFETSIVDKIATVITSVSGDVDVKLNSEAIEKAVSQAMAKYYAENAMANTGLTEAQVKAIVENAFGTFKYEGVSAEQVSTIVNVAVAKIAPLSVTQVQRIVEAAVSRVEDGQLSAAQIATIVANALASAKTDLATAANVNTAVDKVVEEITKAKTQQLTAEQVERIITAAVGAAGTTSWVDSQSYEAEETFTLATAEDVKGLATLVNGGYDFAEREIVLPAEVDLSGSNWTPIGNSYESQFEGTLVGATNGTVITGLTLNSQFNAVRNGLLIDCSSTGNMDKVGVGFVAYLGEGAVLENITFTNVKINITDDKMDGIYIGTAVGYLDGGVIRNVKVTSGYVKGVYRVGGLVGAASYGLIDKCEIGADVVVQSTGLPGTGNIAAGKGATYSGYFSAGGLVGLFRNFAIKNSTTIVNINNTFVNTTNISSAVDSNASYKLGQTDSDTTSVKIYGTGVTVNAYLGNGTIPASYLKNSDTITAATMPLE